jgi:hypothetical protein
MKREVQPAPRFIPRKPRTPQAGFSPWNAGCIADTKDAALALGTRRPGWLDANRCRKLPMHITSAQLMPIATLVAGVLALIIPRCLSYVVAIYLIAVGLTGLNGIYHLVK